VSTGRVRGEIANPSLWEIGSIVRTKKLSSPLLGRVKIAAKAVGKGPEGGSGGELQQKRKRAIT